MNDPYNLRKRKKNDLCKDDDDDFEQDEEQEDDEVSNLLIESVSKSLKRYKIPARSLKMALKNGFRKVLASDFVSSGSWKNLDTENMKKLKPDLEKIRKEILDSEITIEKILTSKLPHQEKVKTIELFDVYQNMIPGSIERVNTKNSLNNLINEFDSYNQNEILVVEKKEEEYKKSAIPTVMNMKLQAINLQTVESVKEKIFKRILQYSEMEEDSSMKTSLKEKILWALKLPYSKIAPCIVPRNVLEANQYCQKVLKHMDSKLYGLSKVKQRILENICARFSNPKSSGYMLALKGDPGVGKSSIAQVIAEAIGAPFERVSLGGIKDATIFRGSDSIWVGSSPSIVLQAMSRMNCSNGVILFDELDKIGSNGCETADSRSTKEVESALLHITDQAHNKEFNDNYLSDFPHDLSRNWFMFSMNDDTMIEGTLKNRLDIIQIDPYTYKDKITITKEYILPKTICSLGMSEKEISITNEAISCILTRYNDDKGLRSIEKVIRQIVNKINMLKRVSLSDGTTGSLELDFTIKNFSLPFEITTDIVKSMKVLDTQNWMQFSHMYT